MPNLLVLPPLTMNEINMKLTRFRKLCSFLPISCEVHWNCTAKCLRFHFFSFFVSILPTRNIPHYRMSFVDTYQFQSIGELRLLFRVSFLVRFKLLPPELFFSPIFRFILHKSSSELRVKLQGEVYLKEGDFSSVSSYSGYTIFLHYEFPNLSIKIILIGI